MGGHERGADWLSAALTDLEDRYLRDARSSYDAAVIIERQAHRLPDERLVQRARLCQANMLMRLGDVPAAATRLAPVQRWADQHDDRELRSRGHLLRANIHRHLGDAARCLENSVLAVELLDDTATTYMHVWHRAKLADALGLAGSLDAARMRYTQTEQLATRLGQPQLLLGVLNNHAYTELAAGCPDRAGTVTARLQQVAAEHGLDLGPADLDTIAAVEIENGNHERAERLLDEAIRRHHLGHYEDVDALAEYLLTLARAQRSQGATGRAQTSLDSSRTICLQRGLGDVLVRVHQEQAELHAARGEYAQAYETHKAFFAAHHAQHSAQREAQARTRQAMFETAEARREAERFREQARRDPLTGLHNRRYLDERLPALISQGTDLTVAIVDVDHFKRINDQLHHDVGDQVLVRVARLLETGVAAVAPDGFVARLGGEEFLIALPGLAVTEARPHLDTIRRAVSAHDWTPTTRGLPVTVSIGAAGLADTKAPTQAALLSAADDNLYAAKHAGRDRVYMRPYRPGVTAA